MGNELARMCKMRDAHTFLVGKLKVRYYFADSFVGGMIILR
jgi:hypothetical protein